ncbi:hypothetical protein B5V02_18450 [Mesorhizobium kowhaii]|uniref:Uncharacterized protein n=2 Tax=Mesorhizobium kowhaii TaxID=1300272 RepID=A0A2W7C1V6_9HYPH|nr:hypothetical protein B5V02_18450 [Mesorhizobium kowhaii]
MGGGNSPVRKDRSLDRLAQTGNVAQFVSFSLEGGRARQDFSRVAGHTPNDPFLSERMALETLLRLSPDESINLRSFSPDDPRSREFIYGIKNLEDAVCALKRLLESGLFVIANETVDVRDGGVSGVSQGGVLEFAPDDTPRCVEKDGVASLPIAWGLSILETVYGFRPDLGPTEGVRLEFSVHPKPCGWRQTHTLLWEHEAIGPENHRPGWTWPNNFSRHIGDKAFGLLMSHAIGLPTPKTTVIPRRVAPFTFGSPTGSKEVWTRTCPREPEPGLYTTVKGWIDPFSLLAREDSGGGAISSVLCQAAVPAKFSGAVIVTIDGALIVEGRQGEGDLLMLGVNPPELLPATIIADVHAAHHRLDSALGPVRFEWVHDGDRVWIVQLHLGATHSTSKILVPGDADDWVRFEVAEGLEKLRAKIRALPDATGLKLIGNVGLTSHIADVVRKAGRPARIIVS